MIPHVVAARSRSRSAATWFVALTIFGLLAVVEPACAQSMSAGSGIYSVKADWLQVGAMPLGRDALHSGSVGVMADMDHWVVDLGWLRAARALSTVQGGYLTIDRRLDWGNALVLPGLSLFGGSAEASRDTTGYNWTAASGTGTGHVARYTHSRAMSFGGGASLAIEYPSRSTVAVRASVAQWMFSGQPLTNDRQRTLAGAGLTVRFGGRPDASRLRVEPTRRGDDR